LKDISVNYATDSVDKTVWLGRQLGAQLGDGDCIALTGDLGGGKTWFTKGIAMALNIDPDSIVSPTFTLVNEYAGTQRLFHIDLYRLERTDEIMALDLDEYFSDEGIVVLEWADRWPRELPDQTVHIAFAVINEHTREVKFTGANARAHAILRAVKKSVGSALHQNP
jgi:tRNA threonylcarbamoyladenosine biosynthesis protein TsaE